MSADLTRRSRTGTAGGVRVLPGGAVTTGGVHHHCPASVGRPCIEEGEIAKNCARFARADSNGSGRAMLRVSRGATRTTLPLTKL
eukprot:1086696-Prymnesium_polylepis.1